MSGEVQEPLEPETVPAGPLDDPFTKIPFHPRKGLDMVAPIRTGLLREIGTVDREEIGKAAREHEVTGQAEG
jgi:hypothetical protein